MLNSCPNPKSCRVYRYDPRRVPRPVLIFESLLHISEQFDYGHLPIVQQLPDFFCSSSNLPKICRNCTPYLAPLYLNRIVLRGTGRQKPQDDIAFGAFNVVVHLFAGVGSCVVKYYEHFAVPVSEIFQECDYAVGIRLLICISNVPRPRPSTLMRIKGGKDTVQINFSKKSIKTIGVASTKAAASTQLLVMFAVIFFEHLYISQTYSSCFSGVASCTAQALHI